MAQSRLLALAILVSSQKPAHVRSLHFHNEERMEISSTFYTVQQDFLFDPGSYTRTGEPIVVRGADGRTGVKWAVGAHVRALQSEGWLAVLEYKADCPLDPEAMPEFLTPSKNGDLKSIPSLTQDLLLVERASKAKQEAAMAGTKQWCGWSSPSLTLCPLGQSSSPEKGPFGYGARTNAKPYGHASSLSSLTLRVPGMNKHRWGCDLELASPKVFDLASPKAPLTHRGPLKSSSSPSKQDHRALLDLNLDISDSLSEEHNNEEGENSFSPHQSSVMSNDSCFPVECFAPDSPMCYDKAYPRAKLKQLTPSSSSDESNINTNSSTDANTYANASINADTNAFGSHLESELNSSSCTTPSSILSVARISSMIGSTNEKAIQESPATSTDRSWKDESIINTQYWSTLPLSNGENNVIRARSRSNSTSERITEITLHELSQYFHMPITQASKELKVGLTVLKKRCREFGIPRWPHRKMKSLESLINNIQDLAKDQGVKSSERVANAVKELEEQKKLMEEMPGTELAERTKRLRQACFKANYKKRRLIGPLQCAISAPPPTKVRIPPFHNQPSIVLDFERGSSHHIGFL